MTSLYLLQLILFVWFLDVTNFVFPFAQRAIVVFSWPNLDTLHMEVVSCITRQCNDFVFAFFESDQTNGTLAMFIMIFRVKKFREVTICFYLLLSIQSLLWSIAPEFCIACQLEKCPQVTREYKKVSQQPTHDQKHPVFIFVKCTTYSAHESLVNEEFAVEKYNRRY